MDVFDLSAISENDQLMTEITRRRRDDRALLQGYGRRRVAH